MEEHVRNTTTRVALITGAGSGLGEATARRFAEGGYAVACVDIKGENAQRVAADVGTQAIGIACDASDDRQVSEAVNRTVRELGGLDVVVSCAAVDYVVSVNDMAISQWDQVIGVNLRGPFLFAKLAWPHLLERGGGHIVNVASTAATRAWGNAAAYHASKWGLVGFSRGLGVEGRPHGIKVTTVIPGGMRTHWFDRFPEQGIPMPDESNLQDPRTVADVIFYATQMPAESYMPEVMVMPVSETSWP